MATVRFQSTRVCTESADRDGRLAFAGDELVGVLVRLDAPSHLPAQRGRWYLEAGFGPCGRTAASSFADLDEARQWIERQFGPFAPGRMRGRLQAVPGGERCGA